MDVRYSRAMVAGVILGVLLTCCNLYFYWLYQQAMANYWASEMSRYVDNLCVGTDTYFYLLIVSTIVYAAGGVASVYYAREYLEHWIQASRVALVAGILAGFLSAIATCVLIVSGIMPGASYSGWTLVYAIYAVIGLFFCVQAGTLCYTYLMKKRKTTGGSK